MANRSPVPTKMGPPLPHINTRYAAGFHEISVSVLNSGTENMDEIIHNYSNLEADIPDM